MRSSRPGFTLIELLVVFALITILAAIFFPVFSAAREKARQAVCLSNQKQLGTSVGLYLQDYDERLFVFGSKTTPSDSHTGLVLTRELDVANSRWWNVLYPYLKNRQVLVCPSDDLPTPSEDAKDGRTILRSYMANRATEGLALAQVPFSADAMVFTEKWGHFYGDATIITGDFWLEAPYGHFKYFANINQMYVVANRHHGGVISVFFDGHARWLLPQTILNSKTLTGCDLIHAYPIIKHGMCDKSVPGCTNNGTSDDPNNPPINICNRDEFTYP